MLEKLDIENLKCIEKASLKLAPLTIITGANSSGKSTALQALMLVIKEGTEANNYRMEDLLNHVSEFSTVRNKKTNAKNINICLSTKEINNTVEFSSTSEIVTNIDSDLNYFFEAKGREVEKKEFFYLNANRLGVEDFVTESKDRKVGSHGQFLFSHFHKIKNIHLHEYLLKPKSEVKDFGFQLGLWLSEITESEIELKTELIGDRVKIFYQVKDINAEISPFNLGAGISYLAKVLILCLMAKKGDLIIIENPEIHLHPKSQAMLGKFFTFISNAGIQIIIETHCEHLINRVRYEVSEENIDCEHIAIHYKASNNDNFVSLFLNDFGHYIDENENRISFPQGFFDISVNALLSIR